MDDEHLKGKEQKVEKMEVEVPLPILKEEEIIEKFKILLKNNKDSIPMEILLMALTFPIKTKKACIDMFYIGDASNNYFVFHVKKEVVEIKKKKI